MQKLEITEALFGELYPFVINDSVTDIKWNGKNVWIDDLKKGRYVVKNANGKPLKLDDGWINIFATKLANTMNVNFNPSSPSLQAETDELRIHIVHKFVSGEESFSFTIRKTPSVSRLAHIDLIGTGYFDEIINAILPAMIRSRMAGCVIGDVGAGKTELEKYLCQFIPDTDGIITVEDTLEMKLPKLYPNKDIISLKVSNKYTAVDAIRDALRLLTKWLILSEARGREIVQVMEAASTGCVAMTSIHAENAWDIPDRMLNMAGDESREGFENDIYTFFNYAVKVKKGFTAEGIQRKVDQLVFFSRDGGKNTTTVFYKDGKLTGEELPPSILEKLRNETEFLKLYCKIFNKEYVDHADHAFDKFNKKNVVDVKVESVKEEIEEPTQEKSRTEDTVVEEIPEKIKENLNVLNKETSIEETPTVEELKEDLNPVSEEAAEAEEPIKNNESSVEENADQIEEAPTEKTSIEQAEKKAPVLEEFRDLEPINEEFSPIRKEHDLSTASEMDELDDLPSLDELPAEDTFANKKENTTVEALENAKANENNLYSPEEVEELEELPDYNDSNEDLEENDETKEFSIPLNENSNENDFGETKKFDFSLIDNEQGNQDENLDDLEDLEDIDDDFSSENRG